MKQVVGLVLDGLGLNFLLTSSNQRFGSGTAIVLPKECGKADLLDRCFAILRGNPARDYALQIVALINANSSLDEVKELWSEETVRRQGLERTRWLEYGLRLGLLAQVPKKFLEELEEKSAFNPDEMELLFRARRWDFLEQTEQTCKVVIDCILDRDIRAFKERRIDSVLDLFANVLEVSRYAIAFRNRQPIKLVDIWTKGVRQGFPMSKDTIQNQPPYHMINSCIAIFDVAEEEVARTAAEWASDLSPWDRIVEKSRSIWGERWAHFHFANVASGIRSTTETCVDFPDLLDHSKSLCRRARYARLRAGTSNWWIKQFATADNELDLMFINLLLLTWGSQKTLLNLSELVGQTLDQLSTYNWRRFIRSLQQALTVTGEKMKDTLLELIVSDLPAKLSERAATALGTRAFKKNAKQIYTKYLLKYDDEDPIVLEFCQDLALESLLGHLDDWHPHLNIIRKSYSAGVLSERYAFRRYLGHTDTSYLDLNIANEITNSPDKYPSELVAFAEEKCRLEVARNNTPVAQIAERDSWFK